MATTPTLSRLLTRHVGILYTPTESLAARWQLQQQRGYAKKNKKKGGAAAESNSDSADATTEIARAFNEKKLQERMDSTIASLKDNFKTLRVGRANPAILDSVRVRIDGSNYSLRDLAQVTIRDPQTLLVSVHDSEFRTAVDKSIRESGLNLNPVIDNEMIRVPVPKATKETRDKMTKLVSQMSEQMKSKIRNIRQDGMKQLKQDSKVAPADEIKRLEKLVQTLTDKHNKNVEELIKAKVKEIQS
ncbi:ribosome recycling factor domain-containing protein [Zychaea mexicana]|uniref:ribosome recycling factor domain-containing protein n=1 Tax=Zychaea mexicana TaxID=64656 RepID=UPI0022FE82F0|nr:ribosome recycling factor domain-containing protein [Zychaea mexicana]KAI9497408.1 ribosome recycling factor domain-containing protein [Zychaea mexicana]